MARSQILKDLISGDDNLESVLMRMKVILSDLENTDIDNWIDSEIQGYGKFDDVPPYRILTGNPMGTYILGSPYNGIKYTNSSIPLGNLDGENKKDLLTLHLTDAILGIKSLLGSKGKIAKTVPPEVCSMISREGLIIMGMTIDFSINQIQGVIANIKNKLTSIILKIEKDFGNLDSLDTFSEEVDTKALADIEKYIINVIYDNSIKIGDNNKIKSSGIGHGGKNE